MSSLARRSCVACAVLALLLPVVAAHAQVERLDRGDMIVLAYAEANQAELVVVNMVARPGMFGQLNEAASSVPGARVVQRAEEGDFIAMLAPPHAVPAIMRFEALAGLTLEDARATNEILLAFRDYPNAGPESALRPKSPATEKLESLPPFDLDNWKNVLRDLNALDLTNDEPTYDGRGVTIGFVETLPDVTAPEFQEAYRLDGSPIRKVIDSIPSPVMRWGKTAEEDRLDGRWRPFAGLSSEGRRAGTLVVSELLLAREGLDICQPASSEVPVLDDAPFMPPLPARSFAFDWDEQTRRVRVDTDCDGLLSDEQPVGLFGPTGETVQLGNPRSAGKDRKSTLTFAVSRQPGFEGLIFQPAISSHVMVTAGAAVANRRPDGQVSGLAPGASIIFFEHQYSVAGYADGLIKAFSDPRTDIILIESNLANTEHRGLTDGGSALASLIGRLSGRYRKPAFVTGGNDIGMNRIDDLCSADLVVCVGTYRRRETTLAHGGVDIGMAETIGRVGASGPTGNGAMKPDLLASENPVVPTLRFGEGLVASAQPTGRQAPNYGYQIGGGTSTAAPVAAGAAALLLSAARQHGLEPTPEQLIRSLYASTRQLDAVPAYRQGRGVIDIGAAYRLLVGERLPETQQIEFEAPIHISEDEAAPPRSGKGLYERSGWSEGMRETRMIGLTRRSGPQGSVTVNLAWSGQDASSFASPEQISLPLGETVQVPVTISPAKTGATSAMLRVIDANSSVPLAEMGATVVVPERIDAESGFVLARRIDIPPLARRSIFFEVPEGTNQLSIALSQYGDLVDLHLRAPSGRSNGRVMPRLAPRMNQIKVDRPEPGVWEAIAVNFFHEFEWWPLAEVASTPDQPVSIEIKLLTAQLELQGHMIEAKNEGAPFVGAIRPEGIGIRQISQPPKPNLAFAIDLPQLPAGVLDARIPKEGGHQRLHLFECAQAGSCRMIATSWDRVASDLVRYDLTNEPYRLVRVADRPSSGAIATLITDIHFGALSTDDQLALRPSGEEWVAQLCRWRPEIEQPLPGEAEIALSVEIEQSSAPGKAQFPADTFPLPKVYTDCN